jgi:cytidylate kinase
LKKIIIAIDGYAGTGKSSTAREVARRLGYLYLDSGSMYRAVTYFFLENGVDVHSEDAIEKVWNEMQISFEIKDGVSYIHLNGMRLTDELRSMEVNKHVSAVSSIASVRRKLVDLQRQLGKSKGIVMDGRDIGTVVFPRAELKVFMVANLEVRGKRRLKELKEKGIDSQLEEVVENLKKRDLQDTERSVSPLKRADGAWEIDTSRLNFEEQVLKILSLAKERIDEN